MYRNEVIEDCAGYWSNFSSNIATNWHLDDVETSEAISELRMHFEGWVMNEHFDEHREGAIDLAVVYDAPQSSDNSKDVDNVGKTVTSALQAHPEDERDRHLVRDDSQIMRMLVDKRVDEIQDQPRVVISFRKHDPERQMVLTETPEVM